MTLRGQLCQRGLWVFIIIAIIVLVVLFYLARPAFCCDDGESWWQELRGCSWGKSPALWAVLITLAVLLFAWGAFVAYSTTFHPMRRNMILAGFVLSMLVLIALFSIFFKVEDGCCTTKGFPTALWLAILAVVLAFACLYPMWHNSVARLAMIPYLVLVIALAVYIWDLKARHCCD
jgi:tryptophan-rich sensory protein